jgi:hypothetical protein
MLLEFKECFKRVKTWQWFVVLVIGLMVRSRHEGVTSILSALRLKPELYHTMLHFFRSTGYRVTDLYAKWVKIVMKHGSVKRIAGRVVLIGDHIKVSKEGLRMPGIEILHQDSQNSGKPSFIAGHNYGQVSAVITKNQVSRSIPLMTEIQSSPPRKEGSKKPDGETIVTQMVNLVHKTAKSITEPVVVALDAYFCSESAWAAAEKTVAENGERLVEIVTRAQTNSVAYTGVETPAVRKRGRPRKYGEKIKLYGLFSDRSSFTQTTRTLYGKKTNVRYLCMDLLWKPVKKQVRFVITVTDSGFCVLMSSSLTMHPETIIEIYALRFKIETSFDEQKNDMGVFAYHFWSKFLPNRNKFKKTESVSDVHHVKKVDDARRATESFVCLSTIATGIITIIAFYHNNEIWKRFPGWLRTLRSTVPSASIVKDTLAHDFQDVLSCYPHLPFCSIIRARLRCFEFLYHDFVA